MAQHIKHGLRLSTLAAAIALAGCGEDFKDCGGTWDKLGRSSCAASTATVTPNTMPTSPIVTDLNEASQRVLISEAKETVAGKLDYGLSPIYCNSEGLLKNQTLTVRYADAQAQVLNPTVMAGSNSFEQCQLLSGDQPTVRIDKTKTLDSTKISIQLNAEQPLDSNPIQLIKVDLYKIGGRAGHEELFPLNTQYPTSGDDVLLKAHLEGSSPKANYELLSATGAILASGVLESGLSGDRTAFEAAIVVPSQPFRVRLKATNSDNKALTWITNTYQPQTAVLALRFNDGVVKKGGQILLGAVIGTAQSTGDLTVRILAPAGFSSDWTQKTVQVKAGDTVKIPYSLTASNTVEFGRHKVFLQYRYTDGSEVLGVTKILALTNVNQGEIQ